MKTPEHDELLSAFYDGELSAAERADVERRLAASEALRGELGSLSQLSTRLSDLADAMPEFDLRDRVLGAIRSSSAAPAPGSTVPPGRLPFRVAPWMWTVAGLGLAALVTMPLVSNPDRVGVVPSESPMVMDGAIKEAPERSVATANAVTADKQDHPGDPHLAATEMAMAGDHPINEPAAPTVAMDAVPSPPAAMAAAMAAPSPESVDSQSESENEELEHLTKVLTKLVRDGRLNQGEVLSRLEADGPVPVLLDYQVVDVERVASDLRVLLHKNGIQSLTPDVAASGRSRVHKDESEELRVIYVCASTEALSSTIETSNTGVIQNQLGQVFACPVDPGLERRGGTSVVASAGVANITGKSKPGEGRASGPPPLAKSMNTPAPGLADPAPQKPQSPAGFVRSNGISVELEDGPQVYAELSQRQSGSFNLDPAQRAVDNTANSAQAAVDAARNGLNLPAAQPYSGLFTPEQLNNKVANVGPRKLQRALIVVRSQAEAQEGQNRAIEAAPEPPSDRPAEPGKPD